MSNDLLGEAAFPAACASLQRRQSMTLRVEP